MHTRPTLYTNGKIPIIHQKLTKEAIPDSLVDNFGVLSACQIVQEIIKRKLTPEEVNLIEERYREAKK